MSTLSGVAADEAVVTLLTLILAELEAQSLVLATIAANTDPA